MIRRFSDNTHQNWRTQIIPLNVSVVHSFAFSPCTYQILFVHCVCNVTMYLYSRYLKRFSLSAAVCIYSAQAATPFNFYRDEL